MRSRNRNTNDHSDKKAVGKKTEKSRKHD